MGRYYAAVVACSRNSVERRQDSYSRNYSRGFSNLTPRARDAKVDEKPLQTDNCSVDRGEIGIRHEARCAPFGAEVSE